MSDYTRFFVDYDDDDAAQAAEDALVEDVDQWDDPNFGADGAALYRDPFNPPRGSLPPDVVDWNRINIGEVTDCDAPETFREGAAAGDVIQGQLGNCWFISAMSVLATQPEYLSRNFVSEKNKGKGIYTLKFYKFGKWRYVHIDDRIPCDRKGRPLFAHGKDNNETWVMVMEKAYAKLHGCYENLKTGYIDYGLRDLTGGMCMKLKFNDKSTKMKLSKGKLWGELMAALEEGSLAGCSFNSGNAGEVEHDRGDGILAGHAYGILQLQEVEEGGDTFKMVQCRNPWGMREWNGDWCDNDVMWEDYPEIKEKLNPGEFVNDGTFWIEWEDFKLQYNQIFLAYDFPPSYQSLAFEGEWAPGETAGGCPKYPTFPKNRQFLFSLSKPATLLMSCTRADHRWSARNAPYTTAVGFVVMAVDGKAPVTKFNPRKMKAMSRTFAKSRAVGGDASLPAGNFAIIPCLFSPLKSGDAVPYVLEVHLSSEGHFVDQGQELQDIDEGLDTLEDEEVDGAGAPARAGAGAGAGSGGEDDDGEYDDPAWDEPEDEEPEPEEEGRGLKLLHSMVGELALEMRELAAEIGSLEARVSDLEA